MGVQWDGSAAFEKFSGAFDSVVVAAGQQAVLFDQGMVMASLSPGTHTPANLPALGQVGVGAELVMMTALPWSAKFGSKGVHVKGSGRLRHFGEIRFTIVQPERFAMEVLGGLDPVRVAGDAVGKLLDACALEWINGGYMTVADLAPSIDKFRQTLGPHIRQAVEPLGMGSVELVDFVPNVG